MNLFGNETKEYLQEQGFSEDWAETMSSYTSIEEMQDIANTLSNLEKEGKVIYPSPDDVFKAFKYPFKDIKVIIIGQDPYFNGNADGLAFSCKKDLSPSLRQILSAMFKDLLNLNPDPNLGFRYTIIEDHWNLEYLAEQGIFLFNPSLTVEKDKPGSHENIWKEFSKKVLTALFQENRNVITMAWGKKARESLRGLIVPGHLFVAEHPAAAARENRIWKCDHFSKTNASLKERGKEEIKWLF